MDLLTDIFTGKLAEWIMATPIGETAIAVMVTVVLVSLALQGVLLLLRPLVKRTPWLWDDGIVARGLTFTNKALSIAREVVAFAPGPFKAIAAALKPKSLID